MDKKFLQHIAIIMDGNGRWAESKGKARMEGHQAGVRAVSPIAQHCMKLNIPVLSLFAFSQENWIRPKEEVSFIMELFVHYLDHELEQLQKDGIKLLFAGDLSELSPELQNKMQMAEMLTKDNTRLTINVAINYGGKWDIVQAAKKLAQQVLEGNLKVDDIDENALVNTLTTAGLPDPDLLIRTSGEQRISNYYLWQVAYTELYFSEVYWPDFSVIELEKALVSFKARDRRYGQISKANKD